MPLNFIREDITRMHVDAIVNAANTSLLGGGGVDGAIHRAAGPELLEACRKLHGCPTGEARITDAYRLPARYVIHTPGPVWQGGNKGEASLLAACYMNALRLAKEYHCESIAFPMISTGAYGYPKAAALRIAIDTVASFLMEEDMLVYLVTFGHENFELSGQFFPDVAAFIDDEYAEKALKKDSRRGRFIRSESLSDDYAISECAAPAEERKHTGFGPGRKARKEKNLYSSSMAGMLPQNMSLEDFMRRQDEGFRDMLLRKIDEHGLKDSECYHRANVDRKLFNKIINEPNYHPSKATAVALAIGLELPEDEIDELLEKAGYKLTPSSLFDRVIIWCIAHHVYNIFEINSLLFNYDLKGLG